MTTAQPIFHALGLLVEAAQREEDALWSHRCSAPVETPGHELVVEGVGVGEFELLERMIKLCLCYAYMQLGRP